MNAFDAAVYIVTFLAVIMGFMSGLLRSLATILAYLAAAAVAVATTPVLTPILAAHVHLPQGPNWIVPAGIFIVSGFILGVILRFVVSELAGGDIGFGDRIAGAFFGGARMLFLAVLLVVVFDRIIPADRQPDFLARSKLRPLLSAAGQQGLRTLPPEIADAIDRMKKERGF